MGCSETEIDGLGRYRLGPQPVDVCAAVLGGGHAENSAEQAGKVIIIVDPEQGGNVIDFIVGKIKVLAGLDHFSAGYIVAQGHPCVLLGPVVDSRRTDKDLGADILHGDPVVNMLVDIAVNPLPDRVVLDPDVFGGDGFDAGKHHPRAGFPPVGAHRWDRFQSGPPFFFIPLRHKIRAALQNHPADILRILVGKHRAENDIAARLAVVYYRKAHLCQADMAAVNIIVLAAQPGAGTAAPVAGKAPSVALRRAVNQLAERIEASKMDALPKVIPVQHICAEAADHGKAVEQNPDPLKIQYSSHRPRPP